MRSTGRHLGLATRPFDRSVAIHACCVYLFNMEENNIDKFDCDTEKFIDEIKIRPALWDCDSVEYTNREMKKKAWDDIMNIFGGKNLSATQRRIMQITLRRKWKGLRGCFTRELKRQESVRAGNDPGARKTEYTHFRQLLFLRNVVTTKTTSSGNEEYLYYDGPNVSTVKQENSYHLEVEVDDDNSKDNLKEESLEEASSECSSKQLKDANDEYDNKDPLSDIKRLKLKKPRIDAKKEDEDLLFLLSMLKTLQRVPFKRKIATKIKLMAVLDEATRDLEE